MKGYEHMRRFCVIGETLKHTMSPFIHNRLFETKGKTAEYTVFEIKPDELGEKSAQLNRFDGYNITIPHKVSIIPFLSELDKTAKEYGAVNCVDIKDGVSKGYNTDAYGFLRALSSAGIDSALSGDVLLLGCGGAGRMMAVEAAKRCESLTIAVRNPEKAKPVAEMILSKRPDLKIKITDFDSICGSFDILLNSTPVGMYPNCGKSPVSEQVVKNCSAVFDAIYNPAQTELLRLAALNGKKLQGGMPMLVAQAVMAHEIWDGDIYTDQEILSLSDEAQKVVENSFKSDK